MTEIINVFVDNTPGRVKSVTETLAQENINIVAFAIHDKGEFGLMKLIATEPERAKLVLAENGFACALSEAMMVAVPDRPGNLNELTGILLEHDINIAGIFGFVTEGGRTGICCLEISEPFTKVLRNELEQADFRILTSMDMF